MGQVSRVRFLLLQGDRHYLGLLVFGRSVGVDKVERIRLKGNFREVLRDVIEDNLWLSKDVAIENFFLCFYELGIDDSLPSLEGGRVLHFNQEAAVGLHLHGNCVVAVVASKLSCRSCPLSFSLLIFH